MRVYRVQHQSDSPQACLSIHHVDVRLRVPEPALALVSPFQHPGHCFIVHQCCWDIIFSGEVRRVRLGRYRSREIAQSDGTGRRSFRKGNFGYLYIRTKSIKYFS
jgi:hypothetical protein